MEDMEEDNDDYFSGSGDTTLDERKYSTAVIYAVGEHDDTSNSRMLSTGISVGFGILLTIVIVVIIVVVILRKRRTSAEIRTVEMSEVSAEPSKPTSAANMNIANFNNESEGVSNTYISNEYAGRPLRKEPNGVSIIGEQYKREPKTRRGHVENEYLNSRECTEWRGGKFGSGESEIRKIEENKDGNDSTYQSLRKDRKPDDIYLQLNRPNVNSPRIS